MLVKNYEEAASLIELSEKDRKSNEAFEKLTRIVKALNEGWVPDWTDLSQDKYCIYSYFRRAPIVGGNAFYGSNAGLVYVYTYNGASYTNSTVGSRLCFKSYELAQYVVETFPELLRDLYALE
jgi:hypothetical protein